MTNSELIANAIAESITCEVISVLAHSPDIARDLFTECEGHVSTDFVEEYYGVNLDGEKWHVHLIR